MKQISTKIFLGYLAIIILLTSLIIFFSYNTIQNHFLENSVKELNSLSYMLQITLDPYLDFNRSNLDSKVKQIGKKTNVRITLIDTNGIVFSDSERDFTKMENHSSRPEVILARKGITNHVFRFSNTIQTDMLYLAIPIYRNNRITGILRLSYFSNDLNLLLEKTRKEMIQISLFVVIISLFGVLVFSRRVSKPINQLSLASRKVASGDFNVSLSIKGHDEISELSYNFNNMAKKLKKLFDKTNNQREQLDTLITNVKEGIAVFNNKDEITLSNESFTKIFKKKVLNKEKIRQIIDSDKFLNVYFEVKTKKGSIVRNIEINDSLYLCSVNFIDSKEEIIFVVHDISDIKKLEDFKRDLVSNVSHELRTPLTAIKGFIETIHEDTDGEIKHYADIIIRHTDRLINIVNDLLTLSSLEDKSTTIHKTPVNIKELIENITKIFEAKLSDKGLQLILDFPDSIPLIMADQYSMEQVFINLVDNAIKYTDNGTIEIKITTQNNFLSIQVIDTGVGIPLSERHRIFERFYVVDKSRSRKVGGTGLGLSITKHIINSNGGEIKVDSNPDNKGTQFIITFPLS